MCIPEVHDGTIASPVTAKAKNINSAHIATRSNIEQMLGVWKKRFLR